jgi:hypothetical protein
MLTTVLIISLANLGLQVLACWQRHVAIAEQRLVEELWDVSRRAYGEARRREICALWLACSAAPQDVCRFFLGRDYLFRA